MIVVNGKTRSNRAVRSFVRPRFFARRRTFARPLCVAFVFAAARAGAWGPPDLGKWVERAPLPTARQEVGVGVLGGKIYVIAGFGSVSNTPVSLNTVERYDPETNAWETIDELPAALPLNHAGVTATGGKLYVVGGLQNNFAPVASVFAYDPAAERWDRVADMPEARGAMGVAEIDGLIYAAGGLKREAGFSAVTDFAVYDPAANQWTTLAPMAFARDHLAAVAVDGKFYAIAGRSLSIANTRAQTEIYDLATGEWSLGPPIPTPRGGIAAAAVDGKIYVFGGEGSEDDPLGVFAQNEVYNTATGAWSAAAPMPFPRHGIGAAVIDRRIYIPGGGPVEGFGVTARHDFFEPPGANAAAAWAMYD